MTPEQWHRIEQLCLLALDQPPADRLQFLASACGDDQELRCQVERLIASYEQSDNFLESPLRSVAFRVIADQEKRNRNHDDTVAIGQTVSHYRIVEKLGGGGMGVVYKAQDLRLGRWVALKFVLEELSQGPRALEQLKVEARAASGLNHPHICTVHDVDEHDGCPFIVMELLEGQTLKHRISCKPLDVKETARLGMQIADALDAAHGNGILHCDIKPANIFLSPRGEVKVLDFGLAKLFQSTVESTLGGDVDETRGFVGTLPYMAPEQLRGNRADVRTDIHAIGAVLYEMATCRRPFRKTFAPELVEEILNNAPTPPAAFNRHISRRLQAIILKCLEKDPGKRYQNAKELLDDLAPLTATAIRYRPWLAATAVLTTIALAAMTVLLSTREPARPANRSDWVQITSLPDAVSEPALSPDGRMLAFVRGFPPDRTVMPGQVYIKILPDGEPVQLTNDNSLKMSPVFSPDGSQIAYTAAEGSNWDTWEVDVRGGLPHLWLRNASGLTWTGQNSVLFSEIRKDFHMGIVAAAENRAGERNVYLPAGDRGMAHRSYASPDAKWALVVEMARGLWLPCRLVPVDGSSPGRQVGPSNTGCTYAAWSPDGKWMYFSAGAGGTQGSQGFVEGTSHIWRQRFPAGRPEQITSGPTEEEGIAVAADARSLITSVGLRESAVWLHDSAGERQISLEGYSYEPKFSLDGRSLYYLKAALPGLDPTQLWVVDLASGRRKLMLPGIAIRADPEPAYDVSRDGRQIVVTGIDKENKPRLWVVGTGLGSPPRPIPAIEGDMPFFGGDGEIFFHFHAAGLDSSFISRVSTDGTGLRTVIEKNSPLPLGISPDHRWLLALVSGDGRPTAFSLAGGTPIPILNAQVGPGWIKWSSDGRLMFITLASSVVSAPNGRTYVVPLRPGEVFPPLPPGGFRSEAEISKLPGVRLIESGDVAPGLTPETYAFSRHTVQRNLYRIPLP